MAKMNTQQKLQFFTAVTLVGAGVAAYLYGFIPWIWRVLLAFSVAGAVASVWLGRQNIQDSLAKRTVRYGLNSVFMSFVVLAIVVVLNLIAANHDTKFDLTKNSLHTLSEQSQKVLRGLEQDVKLTAFVAPIQRQGYQDAFDKYAYYSKKIQTAFVDLDRDPLAAKEHGIQSHGTILVESGVRSVKLESLSGVEDPRFEEKLTNAIIQVDKGDKRKVYFVLGHGEQLVSDSRRETGFSSVRDALASGRFDVGELNLLESEKIPADADVLVIPGPRKQFATHEFTVLDQFVRAGGRLLLMLEPDSTPELKQWLAKFGVEWVPGNVVVEPNAAQHLAGGNPLTPVVTNYDSSHEITRHIGRQPSLFAMSTPVEKAANTPEGITVTPLLFTSRQSTAARIEGGKLRVGGPSARRGPIPLAVAVTGKADAPAKKQPSDEAKKAEGEAKPPEFRLVVVGDSDFASNSLRGFSMNSDLFQNMLSWLVEEEDLISIRPKPTDESHFDITQERFRVIFLASVVFLPFAMLFSGVYVWMRRRRM